MEREYPLEWPKGQPRTSSRSNGSFRRTLTQARTQLIRQTQLAGGSSILISSNYGGLSGKQPSDPGVAIYFNQRGKRLGMGCDTWKKIEHNLSALANTIEAMRGIERWGCGHLMEQAFAAFECLPAPDSWRSVLGLPQDATLDRDAIKGRYNFLVKKFHPDAGGSPEQFKKITDARDAAMKEVSK